MKLRPDVELFAEAMEAVLREHDEYKKGGWDDMGRDDLMYLLGQEFQEAKKAASPADLRREVLDIANYCSMIWSNSRRDFWFEDN